MEVLVFVYVYTYLETSCVLMEGVGHFVAVIYDWGSVYKKGRCHDGPRGDFFRSGFYLRCFGENISWRIYRSTFTFLWCIWKSGRENEIAPQGPAGSVATVVYIFVDPCEYDAPPARSNIPFESLYLIKNAPSWQQHGRFYFAEWGVMRLDLVLRASSQVCLAWSSLTSS